jgi:predicted enzyme related to lactoylglutathione lyase
MTTRDEPFAPGTPCWVDIFSSDVEASKAFYGGLFGWANTDAGEEYGHYVTFTSDGHQVAGMMAKPADSDMPDVWSTYISTADLDASAGLVAEAGGQIVAPPMQVGDLGSMAIATDPAGAMFGLWQPAPHIGFTKYNEPGSVTWDEHHSKDFATTTPFYEKVFGWDMDKTSDTDEFRYFQGQIDGSTVAGLMDSKGFLPPEVPSHWAVYFSVADVDEAVEKLLSLGGSVRMEAQDTPFGRIADVEDSTGAGFRLHSAKLAGAN